MWLAILSLVATTGTGPVPDAAWVVKLAPPLAKCERRGTTALTTWACQDFNFAVCHQDCANAVTAIESSTTRRFKGSGVLERAKRRLPVDGGSFAVVDRTNWIVRRGAVAASLDVMHRDRDAFVCGVSPMNPIGEYQCDALFAKLVESDLTGPPIVPLGDPVDDGDTTSNTTSDKTETSKETGVAAPSAPESVLLSDDRRLAFAIQAYGAADYGRAGALALQVVGSPKATARQRQEALMMTGAIHRLQGRDNQARASFLRVLDDDPKAKLPRVYPIKVRRLFALVQQENRKQKPVVKAAPSSADLGLKAKRGCRKGRNGSARTLTCNDVQLQWRVHKSAADASRVLQDELMAYRAYTGIDIDKRYVECMIQSRASRCIDMTVNASYGNQRALLGYAEVKGKMISVSCRWNGKGKREPQDCRRLIRTR